MKQKKIWRFITLTVVLVITLAALPVWAGQKSISEDDMGFRKQTLFDETSVSGIKSTTSSPPAGKSKKYERSFENSPALIPHSTDGLEVITDGKNECMGCHMPESAKDFNATAIPKTHLATDGSKISGTSYNCLQCHVTQSDAKPLIGNKFSQSFRNKKLRHSSNLSETGKEGIE
ncbi:MAG: nitrate reductase cytochrome c-type subunit [Nitrospirae bacterium YQR-1]